MFFSFQTKPFENQKLLKIPINIKEIGNVHYKFNG